MESINFDNTTMGDLEITSPSQLQEVTLDPNMNAAMAFAIRSPGRTSPNRGRTMKEYEEQLGHLQKENFNLKLRIYFLEERMDHMSGSDDKEQIVKENIELKVKSETLRKELADKQELVCQAAKAVQLMEEQHQMKIKQLQQDFEEQKKSFERHILELEEQLQKLMKQHQEQKFVKMGDSLAYGPSASKQAAEEMQEQKKCIDNLLGQKHQLECSLEDERERANHLEVALQEAHRETNHTSKLYDNLKLEIEERDCKLKELIEELDCKDRGIAELKQKVQALEEMLGSRNEDIKVHARERTERDGIIEQKTNQLKEQHKVLQDMESNLKEKQIQIDSLRSLVMTRDSALVSLEAKYTSAKASARSMELKLDASEREIQRLKDEVNMVKAQMKSGKQRSRDNAGGDNAAPTSSKNKWCYCVDNRSSQKKGGDLEENEFVKMHMSELQAMKNRLATAEETEKKLSGKLEYSESKLKDEKQHVTELESHVNDITQKLKDIQVKHHQAEEKICKMENSYRTACHTLQESIRKSKELKKENEQLKELDKKRKTEMQQMAKKLTEAYSQAKSGQKQPAEAHYLQTDVQMEQDAQNVLPCCVLASGPGDNFSAEVEMMTQFLLKAIKEKQDIIESFETKLAAVTQEMKIKDAHTMKLEEEICELHNCLKVLQSQQVKEAGGTIQQANRGIDNEVSDLVKSIESKMQNMMLCEVQEKNREIERLNAELRKRTTNLQELVNKELWDKNREIEKLQDRLNIMCERKDLQIKAVNQQLTTKELQLKALQEKVVEFLTKAGIPTALVFKELQLINFTQTEGNNISDVTKDKARHLHVLSSACVDVNPNLQSNLLATMEENKYLSQKVEELQERIRNTPERDTESRIVQNLRAECLRLKEELEIAEKRCRDAREGITILTRRLEELALFLSSLLQNRELLRGLSIQRHRVLKQAVENSIELSRRLSLSFASFHSGNDSASFMQTTTLSDIMSLSSLSEFLKEKVSPGETTNDVCNIATDIPNEFDLKCPSISPYNKPITGAADNELQQNCTKELTATTDLITFTPPVSKSAENANEASLSSMTFYNSCHTTVYPHPGSLETNGENAQSLSDGAKLPGGEQVFQHISNSQCQTAKSPPLISFSPACEDTANKGKMLLDKSLAHSDFQRENTIQKECGSCIKVVSENKNQYLSDSEAWSEPDRNVSMERIGLQDEHSKALCVSGSNTLRARNSRIQESDNSSEASEDTAQEDVRMPVNRRIRYESGELKRLQNRLCALELMNDALKNELEILHQLKGQLGDAKDHSVTSFQSSQCHECKKSTNFEGHRADERSVTISVCLLEQIRNQREKLESSLVHNDLIRKQLETVVLNLPVPEVDNAHSLWQKLKETSEDLDLAQNKVHQLEKELITARLQLEESQNKIKILETNNKTLQATDLEKQICTLRATIQEKDNEILERQCLVLELENKAKERSIENEKKLHFDKMAREELERKLADAQDMRGKYERKVSELEQKVKDAELRAAQAESKHEEVKTNLVKVTAKLEQELLISNEKRNEAESELHELSMKLHNSEMKIMDLVGQIQAVNEENKKKESELEEASIRIKDIELAASSKLGELEKQFQEKEWVLKTELERKSEEFEKQKLFGEKLQRRVKELEDRECALKQEADMKVTELDKKLKESEICSREKVREMEKLLKEKENDLHRQLDEAAVAASSLTLERTKLVNEKLRLEQDVRRLDLRLTDVEKNSQEKEKQLQAANYQLEAKVKKLQEEKDALKKSVQELEFANSELEKNLAKINERNQQVALSVRSGHTSGVQEKSVGHKVDLISPSSLSSGFDVFSGESGSLPTSLWSLPSRFFDSMKDSTNSSGMQHVLARHYSDLSDGMSEELASDEYRGMVPRVGRQLSAPCEQQLDSFETRNTATSPDLGIESDQGRLSSLEAAPAQTPLLHLERTQHLENQDGIFQNNSALVSTSKNECNDLILLREENTELKRRLIQTRKALEKTVEQLVSANQRKKQVEKAICKQLYKTHTILKQSRVNLQSETTEGSCTEEYE
ncbi:centrosomin-like isoform X2 [Schistocerca nitens]|uniref:centrosomin-like isoform X2 n=1 Tax=Schistocerca nitens TaxID=7011 RepID=UPI0021184D0F|nr:centrosomin-like isoform X2 [Schistocerca nitens]